MVGGVGTSGQTRRGYSRHSPASYRASNKRGGQVFRLDPAKIWAAPEAQVSIGVAMSGASSIERFAPLYQHMIAVEPDQELANGWDRAQPVAGTGGSRRIGQIPISWVCDRAVAVTRARELFRRLADQGRPVHPGGV
jgi:hypothetical protein